MPLIDKAPDLATRADMMLCSGPSPRSVIVTENCDGHILVPETALLYLFAARKALVFKVVDLPDGLLLMQEMVTVTDKTDGYGGRYVVPERKTLRHGMAVCVSGQATPVSLVGPGSRPVV